VRVEKRGNLILCLWEQNVGKRRRWCSGGYSRNFHGFLHRWGSFVFNFFFSIPLLNPIRVLNNFDFDFFFWFLALLQACT
jgi:hypothetical protein